MKTSLDIMVVGIGSRFGGEIKQLKLEGLNDEIIIDYSIHEIIRVEFNKVIFISCKDIENDFKERIGERVKNV